VSPVVWFKLENKWLQKMLALTDQGLASAANFAILILLAWSSTAAEVGLYAIAVSVIVIATGVQDALITRPYTLQFLDQDIAPARHAGGALLLSATMATALGSLAALAAGVSVIYGGFDQIALLLAALAVALPGALMREFMRRFFLARIATAELVVFDLASIALMSICLVSLSLLDALNAATALFAIGSGYGLTCAIWIIVRREWFDPAFSSTVRCAGRFWQVGKWLLPGRAARELQGYLSHWYAVLMMGATATGIFAACLSIVAVSNPFVIGLLNLMTPRAVRTLKHRGEKALRHQTIVDAAMIGGVMFGFTLLIALSGETIMDWIFPAQSYAGNGLLLTLLTMSAAIAATGGPASIALLAMGLTKTDAKVALAVCALQLVLIPSLMIVTGLVGAAIALAVGETIGFLIRWGIVLSVRAKEVPTVIVACSGEKPKGSHHR